MSLAKTKKIQIDDKMYNNHNICLDSSIYNANCNSVVECLKILCNNALSIFYKEN